MPIGYRHSKETLQKLREAKLRNPVKFWLGKKLPEAVRKKLSEARKGKLNPKLSQFMLGKKGPESRNWKGGIALSTDYAKKRKLIDPRFRLTVNLRSRLNVALKRKVKSAHTMELIGCTIDELWNHLESQFQPGMTRDNYGKWHVDHIKLLASFDLTDHEQQRHAFHYTNLQPLWAIDNLRKNKKYGIQTR